MIYTKGKHNRVTIQVLSLISLAATMLQSCSERVETEVQPPVVIEEPEPIGLAVASISSSNTRTRLDNSIIQLNNATSFRDISDFHFVAFYKENSKILSITNTEVDNLRETANKTNSRFHHFGYCDMPIGANGCLVYGKAEDVVKSTSQETNIFNGSLKMVLPDYLTSTSDIYAEPVSIYPDETTIPTDAQTLADALTYITDAQGKGGHWTTFSDEDLRSLFSHFTNYGYDLPGSAASVREWIYAVRNQAEKLSYGSGTTNEAIRDDIIARADEKLSTIAALTYPQDIGLPDGAAALRWTNVVEEGVTVKKFVPQLQTTTLDDINSVSRFAYPPALYYRVESNIQTSNDKVEYDKGDGEHGYRYDADWNTVLGHFTSGGIVTADTKTVAITDPLQYAVAQLKLKVQIAVAVTGYVLPCDKNNNTVAYTDGTNSFFRLTGVIVGGQRKVGYDFKPIDNSDMDVKFVYDSQVPTNFVLKKGSVDELNTLVLQTNDNEDLNVILEFEYTGAEEFKCLNGYVYPNTRFYLVGEIKAKDFVQETGDETSRGRVFTQDYTTTIQMTVSSLEKAYNVLPSIISQNLEIGVMTTPMWRAAQPSDPVIMD